MLQATRIRRRCRYRTHHVPRLLASPTSVGAARSGPLVGNPVSYHVRQKEFTMWPVVARLTGAVTQLGWGRRGQVDGMPRPPAAVGAAAPPPGRSLRCSRPMFSCTCCVGRSRGRSQASFGAPPVRGAKLAAGLVRHPNDGGRNGGYS